MTMGGVPEVSPFFSLGPERGLDARGNGKQENFPCCGKGEARGRVELVRSQHRGACKRLTDKVYVHTRRMQRPISKQIHSRGPI